MPTIKELHAQGVRRVRLPVWNRTAYLQLGEALLWAELWDPASEYALMRMDKEDGTDKLNRRSQISLPGYWSSLDYEEYIGPDAPTLEEIRARIEAEDATDTAPVKITKDGDGLIVEVRGWHTKSNWSRCRKAKRHGLRTRLMPFWKGRHSCGFPPMNTTTIRPG